MFGLKCGHKLWSGVVEYGDSAIVGDGIQMGLWNKYDWDVLWIAALVLFDDIAGTNAIEFKCLSIANYQVRRIHSPANSIERSFLINFSKQFSIL